MAQSVLEILIKAKDMASGALKQFDKQLVKTAKDVEGVEKSNKKAVGSFTELNSLLSLVDAGLKYVSAGYQALVTDTIAYGKQVDDLSRALGTGTEEARLRSSARRAREHSPWHSAIRGLGSWAAATSTRPIRRARPRQRRVTAA